MEDDKKRLGRAIVFIHQHDQKVTDPHIRAEIEVLLLTGKAMDFASRLRGHQNLITLSHEIVEIYAKHAGLGNRELFNSVLPALKQAGLVEYSTDNNGRIVQIVEFLGVSASISEQTVQLLESLDPTRSDLAFLHSVEIGAIAPLAESRHLDQIVRRGYSEKEAVDSLRLSIAVGLNLTIPSDELNEKVVFSPYVWGTKQISLAKFLSELPPNERDALLGMSRQVLETPGLHMAKLSADPNVIRSARNVGLIQSAKVQSSTGASSEYVFSPLLEAEDNLCSTTEAFHLRKLFVAHILFGHEMARATGGKIVSPVALVNSLVTKGRVGPATNIGTDYYLLEAAGVVSVEPAGGRAFLRLVKPEIAKDGLKWIRQITDSNGSFDVTLSQSPSKFLKPEDLRSVESEGAAHEIMVSSVNELRKETQRAARGDDPWS